MKICLVVDFYPPHIGGSEVVIENLAEGLAGSGNPCVVITSRTDPRSPRIEERRNLKIVRLPIPALAPRFWFGILAVSRIVRHARECEIIHGSSYGGAFPAFLGARLLRKPAVFTVYEFMSGMWNTLEPNPLFSSFYRAMEWTISRLPFERFLAPSRYTRNCLRILGIPDRRLDYYYFGWSGETLPPGAGRSVRDDCGWNHGETVFLAYGRAGITKGFEHLVEAAGIVIRRVPQARFLLVLTRDRNHIWRRIIRGLQALPPGSFRLVEGGVSRGSLLQYMGAADIVVIPSVSEGFGFTTLEACSLGKTVVATDAGSIPEVIFGHHVLVKPASASAIADGCIRAISGAADYAEPKRFEWKATVERFLELCREAAGSAPASRVDG